MEVSSDTPLAAPLADWEAVKAACGTFHGRVIGRLVRWTSAEDAKALSRVDSRAELWDLASEAFATYLLSLKNKVDSGKVRFANVQLLESYVMCGLWMGPKGRRFTGTYLRLLRRAAATQRRMESLEAAAATGREVATLVDPALATFTRNHLRTELLLWCQFMATLKAPNKIVAATAYEYVVTQMMSSCGVDQPASIAIVLERLDLSNELDLEAKAVKALVISRETNLTSNAFDSRADNVRKLWRRWLDTVEMDVAQSSLMLRVLGRPRRRASTLVG
jgi:hypothetical protein